MLDSLTLRQQNAPKHFHSVVRINYYFPQITVCDTDTFYQRTYKILYFIDRASRYKFLLITNLTHYFMYLFI